MPSVRRVQTTVTVVGVTTQADSWQSVNLVEAQAEAEDFVARLLTANTIEVHINLSVQEDA